MVPIILLSFLVHRYSRKKMVACTRFFINFFLLAYITNGKQYLTKIFGNKKNIRKFLGCLVINRKINDD